jgi:hypothetical protein
MSARRSIPLWLKIAWTILVLIIVPVYWRYYGPKNFLWFSDIALIVIAFALWLESRLLFSMMAVGVLALELLWNFEFITRLIFGASLFAMAEYMWDQSIPLGVRLLSLFHIPMPIVLIWMLHRLGYDCRAFVLQTALAWIVLPLSYAFAGPDNNINWVHGLTPEPQQWMHPLAFFAVLMIGAPLVIYLPTHVILARLFTRPDAGILKRVTLPA